MSVDAILAKVPDDVQGITLSGGEPLQQDLDAIYYLITKAKDRGLSVVMFTGYAWTEIFQMGSKAIQIFRECDLIISGRYRRDLPPRDSTPLIASENQLLFFPTGRYEKKDLNSVAKLEILFDVREGRTIKTGVNKKEKS
jgi:anaerobic ribonucleoside-triphosphate reductase activating protein